MGQCSVSAAQLHARGARTLGSRAAGTRGDSARPQAGSRHAAGGQASGWPHQNSPGQFEMMNVARSRRSAVVTSRNLRAHTAGDRGVRPAARCGQMRPKEDAEAHDRRGAALRLADLCVLQPGATTMMAVMAAASPPAAPPLCVAAVLVAQASPLKSDNLKEKSEQEMMSCMGNVYADDTIDMRFYAYQPKIQVV